MELATSIAVNLSLVISVNAMKFSSSLEKETKRTLNYAPKTASTPGEDGLEDPRIALKDVKFVPGHDQRGMMLFAS